MLYKSVFVPYEVTQEIVKNNIHIFAVKKLNEASFLIKADSPLDISPILRNILDIGEASVIQLALNKISKLFV